MALSRQTDLFKADLLENQPAYVYRPNPDKVRRRLRKLLVEARAQQNLTWERTTVSLYRTIFPR